MLERLFGSKTRTKILRLFFTKIDTELYVREITRILDEQINSIRRELENLQNIGLLKSKERDNKKYYSVNTDFILFEELKNLIVKSRVLLEKEFNKKFKKITGIKLLILTGHFTGVKESTLSDILIIGKVSRTQIERIIDSMSKDFMIDLHYTILDKKEFEYRKNMTDKFLYSILKNKNIVVIDKLGIEGNK